MNLLEYTLRNIQSVRKERETEARERFKEFAIPKGSLGRLEDLATFYTSIRGTPKEEIKHKVVFVMVGDHGVAEEGVSSFPQEVTCQMVKNFLNGGAAINVLASHVGARVVVVDCGVARPLDPSTELKSKKIGYGTRNIANGPAMTTQEAERALEVGIEVLEEELERGVEVVATGDMGIANTTASAAIFVSLTGVRVEEAVGRGTGVCGDGLSRKAQVVKRAIEVNRPDPNDPLDVLAKIGGYEIGATAGLCLGAARHHLPILLDGFISTTGALLACALEPKVKGYLLASHLSAERGHALMLQKLGLKPVLDLDMRLGEGTGAVLVMPLVEASVKLLLQMATFSQAGVSRAKDM
ncbi:MAG TPA: nicotinate-nucleotide--dimethylbenzimidazole phosphoribosyltransferase [Candidatus Hypogeohydataceae bacterium YC41]